MSDRARVDGVPRYESPVFFLLPLAWIAWLLALYPPVTGLLEEHPAPARLSAILAGVAIFVVIYVWAALRAAWGYSLGTLPRIWLPGPPWLPFALLASLALILNVVDGPRWIGLFIYTSATIGGHLPARPSVWLVAALTPITATLGHVIGASWSDLVWPTFIVALTGGLVILMSWALRTNRELIATREENARLAVAAERLRFARDLHDLLGHNLSLIALKSELAEYLVTSSPEGAVAAMREVGSVARTALQEVRQAVAGYRQPTLASELRDAREILDAAGIALELVEDTIAAPPAVEAVLAWTVREGVTNVIRHSRARCCAIRVTQQASYVGVEVIDDGVVTPVGALPTSSASKNEGSGLRGLAERVAVLDGQCEFGPRHEGGFRLAVTLRLTKAGQVSVNGPQPHTPTHAHTETGRGNESETPS